MTETIYFGTYTRRSSEGVYCADFDDKKGKLSHLRLVAKEPSPTYLAFDSKNRLYTVGAKDNNGGIAAFNDDFSLINHIVEEGAPLCYVSVDEERHLVYGANYHKGEVLVYQQNTDGSLSLLTKDTHSGNGPHENQQSAHVHFADLTPDHYLITCDLGSDEVTTYTIIEDNKLKKINTYTANKGSGCRHIIFNNAGDTAYLICELSSTIEVLNYKGQGKFEKQQTISTLPADFSDFNGAAAIRISRDNRFIYASNRGHNSIAIFAIGKDHLLTLVDIVPTNGQNPRDFNLTKEDRFIIAAHQDSDNVTIFARDHNSGKLKELSHDFYLPEGVCVLPH